MFLARNVRHRVVLKKPFLGDHKACRYSSTDHIVLGSFSEFGLACLKNVSSSQSFFNSSSYVCFV